MTTMTGYEDHIDGRRNRGQAIPLEGQVPNSAGGAAYPVDQWTRLERFLVLGSEGGSYYASERALTRENAAAVELCLAEDGQRAIRTLVDISQAGRAPKNDPALFVLALAAASENEATRKAAFDALPRVARTGTHLFQFAEAVGTLRGWGRGLRNAIARWYLAMDSDRLALQAVKYKQREGWTHRDLLRLAHPAPDAGDVARRALFDWICGRPAERESLPALVRAADDVQQLEDAEAVAKLVRETSLPREAVPTQFLTERAVWDALLADMPLTATIRSLNRMTAVGLLSEETPATDHVASLLSNVEALAKARVHPLTLLVALKTYASGRGLRGSLTWKPVRRIVEALDRAFYQSFELVEPTGARLLLALDVSGSMARGQVAGAPLTPREAAAAMAMVTAATEKQWQAVAFTTDGPFAYLDESRRGYGVAPVSISPSRQLDEVVRYLAQIPMGGTDCALPMLYARDRRIPVDVFVVYTDSETWAGNVHPVEALRSYRAVMGIPAKLVVVGMVSNGFSIADPNDGGMLDVVGFDAAAPALIADFARAHPGAVA